MFRTQTQIFGEPEVCNPEMQSKTFFVFFRAFIIFSTCKLNTKHTNYYKHEPNVRNIPELELVVIIQTTGTSNTYKLDMNQIKIIKNVKI